MSGFQFKLKKKDSGPEKPGGIRKPIKPSLKSTSGFGKTGSVLKNSVLQTSDDDSDNEDSHAIAIDSFDHKRGGAISGAKAVNLTSRNKPLVITPVTISKSITTKKHAAHFEQDKEARLQELEEQAKKNKLDYGITKFDHKAKESDISEKDKDTEQDTVDNVSLEDRVRQSLLSGEEVNDTGRVIPIDDAQFQRSLDEDPDEDSAEEYEKVPVEQFGAALLRGMGWKPETKPKNTTVDNEKVLQHRQKGVLVGIGAKAVENDLMEDIIGKRGTKFEVPLAKRNKETGEVVRD
ncbi:hypothetical protein G9P44_001880 [Scheffersomyces stipitis]|nr:hypothetical protein G9P44_001880 [Scheffersomyces stipitis]